MVDFIAPEPPKKGEITRFIPTKTEMEHCPLCLKKWKIVEEEGKFGSGYFACLPCEISIKVSDPMVGMYFMIDPVECPVCNNSKTRVFYRSDGYLKYSCPKCKGVIESVDENKHNKVLKAEVAKGVRWMPKKPEIKE